MQAGLEFCLLGPLVVRRDGVAVALPEGKQRALLAALLLRPGRVVAADELAELLWAPAAPPPSAPVTVRNYVKRLRHALGSSGQDRIITRSGGYLIRVEPGELDVWVMEQALAAAHTAASEAAWPDAARHAATALKLWRGNPLSGIDSPMLTTAEVSRLTELRLQAHELRLEADLRLGRHAVVVTELRRLTAANPLHEHLHAMLMLALYRCGRRAEALAAYRESRTVLIKEMGGEPGPELQTLHQQILHDDPTLAPRSGETRADRAVAVPQQLPAAVRCFTGRAAELDYLSGMLSDASGARSVVISAIGGTAGVGKTALAVYWAHQAAWRFPDGQLYVNLRGYDPGQPMPPAEALAGFLRSLGLAGQDIPAGEADRAAQYRSLLAGRRMLVVLDNAWSAEQVRPLLPGYPACAVVVTSRDVLTGLVARDGARRLDLDLLPLPDAVGLLRALIGARVDADPAAAAALASQCCRLPLALRVAAELAADHPAVQLAELADELADRQRRLDLLDAGGDPRSAIRTVFSWSYRNLDPGAARAFRLLGLHRGPDLDLYATAALTGTTMARAGQLLNQLARAHLIQPAGPGRYGLHDLLRAYAGQLTVGQRVDEEQRTALTRLFDYYLHTAATAMDTLHPAEHHRRPRIPTPITPIPPLAAPAAAHVWLDTELPNLVAVAAHTAEHGWPGHATRLASVLFRYLDIGGHFTEAATIQGHALRAARQADDHAAEASALTSFGAIDMRQGRYHQATGRYRQAVTLFRKISDRAGEARAIGNLGALDLQQGRYQQASGHLQQALTLHRETGDRSGEAHALSNLGLLKLRRGSYRQAADYLQQALTLCRETGYQAGEIHALCNLGAIDLQQGCHREAGGYFQEALALCRETGDRTGEAEALNGLGEVFLATGQPSLATARYLTALGLADQTADEYEQARAHNGLARAYHAAGDHGQARQHWREALALYETLGAPEADHLRAQLIAAGDDTYPEQHLPGSLP